MEKLNELKKKIQEKNPDLVKQYAVCPGCGSGNCKELPDCLRELGRPIRLADVLLAITQTGYVSSLLTAMVRKDGTFSFLNAVWNLKNDNLDYQSEETINFLWELLCQK